MTRLTGRTPQPPAGARHGQRGVGAESAGGVVPVKPFVEANYSELELRMFAVLSDEDKKVLGLEDL